MPQVLETICYSSWDNLDAMLEKIYDCEKKHIFHSKSDRKFIREKFGSRDSTIGKNKVCYVCKENGHIAKDCRKGKVKDFRCGKMGIIATNVMKL
ncbi:hypothetical protein H312_00750 [Anncaliia algerae PRA339]|uniref:CCHC-type domain-containing protein n=1 Tax=Anncaliia algerae PRA339 TaxID=1288291 RepID=A0A059F4E8_9MICR|nr:hypothetical protein H312_00750 [Anncaliia algerae PRA339]